MSRYAEVIIDIAYNKLDRPFTYRVPGRMQQVLQPGSLVMVPFGSHNGIRKGYVIALKEECDLPPEKIKEIAELPVSDSGYSEDEDGATAIALAAWMKNRCGSTDKGDRAEALPGRGAETAGSLYAQTSGGARAPAAGAA